MGKYFDILIKRINRHIEQTGQEPKALILDSATHAYLRHELNAVDAQLTHLHGIPVLKIQEVEIL